MKPSSLHTSPPTPLCAKKSPSGSYFLLTAWIFTAATLAQADSGDRFVYEALTPRFGFPIADASLLGAVLAGDQPSVRRHAWDLWAALTAPSESAVDGQRLPVFETWYSL